MSIKAPLPLLSHPAPLASPRRSVPPYSTGRVRIGWSYVQRQSNIPDRSMYDVQTALLFGGNRSIHVSRFERLVAFFNSFFEVRYD